MVVVTDEASEINIVSFDWNCCCLQGAEPSLFRFWQLPVFFTFFSLFTAVRPLQSGTQFFYLNVVDVECHQLVRNWLVCVSCQPPVISKTFELQLPAGQCHNYIIHYMGLGKEWPTMHHFGNPLWNPSLAKQIGLGMAIPNCIMGMLFLV